MIITTKPGPLFCAMSKPRAISSVAGLAAHGLVPSVQLKALAKVEENFSTRLTPEVLKQIKSADFTDPLFRQYVPSANELNVLADELADPTGDGAHSKVKGIIHRYQDRLLLTPTHTCQVYCRFCFRRETVGKSAAMLSTAELSTAFAYIAAQPQIHEVILSGGDPLVLSDRRLKEIMQQLAAIAHVQVIRIHTRVPLVEPTRITPALLKILSVRPAVYVAVHVNHAAELSQTVCKSLKRLTRAGIPLLSQTVLLKGVNDDAEILATLFRALVANRVKPYYLHHLDRAKGTSHFRVSIKRGQEIMRSLRGKLSGIAQPTYVIDIPGGFGKVPIGPDYVSETPGGAYEIADPSGRRHHYRDKT